MRTNTLNPLHSVLPTVLLTSAKIILPILILLYGVFNFSAHYWIIIGLLFTAVLAVSHRISHPISQSSTLHNKNTLNTSNVITADGGTFSYKDNSREVGQAHTVVLDGGISKDKNHK